MAGRNLVRRSAAGMLLSFAVVASSFAAGPDAGALRQQIETERGPQPLPGLAPEKPALPPALTPTLGPTITVAEFRFAGNTLIPSAKLAEAVAGYLNRPLDFAQLQAAAAAVAEVYRDAGWVVRSYLPKQDVTSGIVTIQIVEAVFGKAIIENTEPTRVPAARVLAIVTAQQQAGEFLSSDAVDRALLLADDVPGVAVAGSLKPGANPGETDLALKLANKPLFTGSVTADDFGARATGAPRQVGDATLNSSVGGGELLSANLITSLGSEYGRFAATLPVGDDGVRIGANVSDLRYTLVSHDFKALDANGRSPSVGAEMSYPVIRSRMRNLYLSLSYDHKTFLNYSGGVETSRYHTNSGTAALNGNLFDNLGGGGANAAGLALVEGNVNLDGSPNVAADAATTRTNGSYAKLRYNLSRQQVLTEEWSLYGAFSGQTANKTLDSSEKFYLGGPDAVRAYPVNEGGGTEGRLATAELRWRFLEGFTATGFYDFGRVVQNHDNRFGGGASPNGYSLQGAGLALAWASDFGLNLKGAWAHRIGDNPNPSANGNDQDGSLLTDRFWIAGSFTF